MQGCLKDAAMGREDRKDTQQPVSESLPDREPLPLPPDPAGVSTHPERSQRDIETGAEPPRPVNVAAAAAVSDSVPETFGRYRLIKLLGEGAMGSVYLAEDTQLRRQMALKVPKFSGDAGALSLERFYREARAAAALRHPNICPVFDVGEINGQHYITMAYIEGRPLSDFVDPDNPAPADQAASLVRRLADALRQAHAHGVIHRDLKPANIIVDETREPIVMDFGLARQMESDDVRLTSTGAILGSPAYMSPEQAQGQHDLVGPVSDIYSLGVILYELLTGDLPFRGSLASVLVQILMDEPQKPSERRDGLDPRLESICLKMMAKQIADRYPSMSAVSEALSGWLSADSQTPQTPVDLAAFDAEKAVRDVRLEKLQAYQQQAQSLRERGRYDTALKILKKMAGLKDTRYAEYAEWARAELPRVRAERAEPEQIRKGLSATCRNADELIERHDYRQAVEILRQIPKSHRNSEVERLLEEATDLADEVADLTGTIEMGLGRQSAETLLPKVRRLLELRPRSKRARKWHRRLTRIRWLGVLETYTDHAGNRYFDVVGRTVHASTMWSIVGVAVVAFGLTTWAVVDSLSGKAPTSLVRLTQDEWKLTSPIGPEPIVVDSPSGTGPTSAVRVADPHISGELNSIGMLMVLIPKGEFRMGSPVGEDGRDDDENQVSVTISRDFEMSAHEVTVGQVLQWLNDAAGTFEDEWIELDSQYCPVKRSGRRFVLSGNSFGQSDDQPMVEISWLGATAFCEWLSGKEGRTYRLPTEAEWEYAYRAGTTTAYYWGDDARKLGDHAWHDGNSNGATHPVGQKLPNNWGLFDMSGNVWEWTADWYDVPLRGGTDPRGPSSGSGRSGRGGSWRYSARYCRYSARYCRSAFRFWYTPSLRYNYLGFRMAAVPGNQ
jgi:formylglycine-generating enzyme required for sulfatase activity/predicted Ser/Thr protein kinase